MGSHWLCCGGETISPVPDQGRRIGTPNTPQQAIPQKIHPGYHPDDSSVNTGIHRLCPCPSPTPTRSHRTLTSSYHPTPSHPEYPKPSPRTSNLPRNTHPNFPSTTHDPSPSYTYTCVYGYTHGYRQPGTPQTENPRGGSAEAAEKIRKTKKTTRLAILKYEDQPLPLRSKG